MAPIAPTPQSLTRLLTRLETSLSSPELTKSPYERNRIAANIEHSRALLLTLEKDTATIRTQSTKQATQADLQSSREWIKRLNTRLLELNAASGTHTDNDDDSEEDEEDDDDDDDDEKRDVYAPAIQTEAGLETGESQDPRIDPEEQQTLRSRRPPNLAAGDNRSAASTTTTTAREQLFAAGRTSQTQAQQQQQQMNPDLSKSEAMLSHNRTEQESLTTGLLALARSLKESSQQFGASLESEKDIVKRAEGGLDKNAAGMQAAEQKMGTLRRMSEGQGWWGRIKLYGFIAGLWVACFLVVFIGPKLRF